MKKALILSLALLLSACSSQFAYNNLDWLIHWYLDDYIELEKSQKTVFDEQMLEWLSWHRKDELTRYKAHLEEIKTKVGQPITTEEVLAEFAKGRGHWERLRGKVAPELAEMAVLLNDDQVTSFFAELEKQNTERRERMEKREEESEEERMKARVKDMESDLKERIGKLTKQQKALLADYAPQFRANSSHWLEYRLRTQDVAKTLFENRKDNPNFVAELSALMSNPDIYRHQELVENSEFNGELYAQMVVDISSTLTEKQIKRLNRNLDNFIDDLQDLIDG